MGYSFLDENTDKVRGLTLNGVTPTYETISGFDYPGARPLYIYAKGEHVAAVPGLREFLAEYASAWGDKGYIAERGLVASPSDVQARATAPITSLTPVSARTLTELVRRLDRDRARGSTCLERRPHGNKVCKSCNSWL